MKAQKGKQTQRKERAQERGRRQSPETATEARAKASEGLKADPGDDANEGGEGRVASMIERARGTARRGDDARVKWTMDGFPARRGRDAARGGRDATTTRRSRARICLRVAVSDDEGAGCGFRLDPVGFSDQFQRFATRRWNSPI